MLDDPRIAALIAQLAPNLQQQQQAKRDALLAAAAQMFGARKGREGEAIGRSMAAFGQVRGDSLQQARGQNMQGFQLAQLLAQQDEQKRQREGMQAAYQNAVTPPMGPPNPDGSMPPGGFDLQRYGQGMMQFNPQVALKALEEHRQSQPQPSAEASPFAKIDPKDYDPESVAAFMRTKDPSVLRRYADPAKPESPIGKVSPGDFTPQSLAKYAMTGNFADLIAVDKTPRTTVNIDNAPKLPPGYRWKDGKVGQEVEPIAGGPQDTSKEDAAKAGSQDATRQVVLSAIGDAKKLVGLGTAGLGGAVMGRIPGTSAVDLQKKIDTVRSNIGFDKIQAMRDQSKTGGALGQVAVQELNMLQATLGSLDREQSPAQLRKTLESIERHYKNATMILDRISKGERTTGATGGWSIQEVK